MPPVTQQSGLLAKLLGQRGEAAFEKFKTDEVPVVGGGNLPAGISGVAQLKTIRIAKVIDGKPDAGKPFFYAAGIVIDPPIFTDSLGNKHHIKGARTSITKVLKDNPTTLSKQKTVEECLQWVIGQLQLLIGPNEISKIKFSQIEWFCSQIQAKKPYFNFSTFMPSDDQAGALKLKPGEKPKEPRVIQVWKGVCEWEEGVKDPSIGVEDATVNAPSHPAVNGASKSTSATPATKVTQPSKPVDTKLKAPTVPTITVGSADQFNEDDTIESLLAKANDGDADAKNDLQDRAKKAGHSEEDVNAAETWEQVVELINSPKTNEVVPDTTEATGLPEPHVEKEEPSLVIAVGSMCNYKPYSKAMSKYLDAVPCAIEEIDKTKEMVTIRNYDDGKTKYRSVPFTKLMPWSP
jgi:hypothetical protein